MTESRRKTNWSAYIRKRNRQRIVFTAILLVLIPCILLSFWYLFQGKHYGILSLLVLGAVLILFALRFEMRRPRAREVVLLASVVSLTTAANEICAHTVPLHAGTALVILSGIALGPESGFLIGVLSRLICNFFDGQGPWTPWQMFAWGLLGCLAGFLFNSVRREKKGEKKNLAARLSMQKDTAFRALAGPLVSVAAFLTVGYVIYLLWHAQQESFFGWRIYVFGTAGLFFGALFQRKRLPAEAITITVFTFVTVIFLYGGIMNFAAMLLNASASSGEVSIDALKALYITGLPYDISHAAGAAVCVFFFGDGILQRLERICVRFGIVL